MSHARPLPCARARPLCGGCAAQRVRVLAQRMRVRDAARPCPRAPLPSSQTLNPSLIHPARLDGSPAVAAAPSPRSIAAVSYAPPAAPRAGFPSVCACLSGPGPGPRTGGCSENACPPAPPVLPAPSSYPRQRHSPVGAAGTYLYMSPERFGNEPYSFPSDIWCAAF